LSVPDPRPRRTALFLSLPRWVLAGAIWLYQKLISPLFPRRCRFYPSCSQYAREAVLRYGALRGGYMAVRRLLRCNPWNPGGYDPVK